ncbi:site-2 protease family protein [Terriglobus albidus]|uniref:Site-2 protease family protein n=1 Tax=Terriglobus albidus TaxID=1592106 RepID=A0A5B9E7P4_9BACT|nr:site-2 protease family protein [Terriglobus albidus]QEE27185.1 site-2 protease family protein [Terriglobus albidus]
MNQEVLLILFEFVVLVFAFCIHEAAHAWMANRLGDPTARMLGRITLNPVKHIDPFGSVIMPLIAMFYHMPLIGWAKPTPVTPRNFKNYKRDDILVTLAGPASNLFVATSSLLLLLIIKHATADGGRSVLTAVMVAFRIPQASTEGLPALFPIALLLYFGVLINLSLFVFNLIPLPPLDGSKVLRHFLPYSVLETYDRIGMFSILILMFLGGRLISIGLNPLLGTFNSLLLGM